MSPSLTREGLRRRSSGRQAHTGGGTMPSRCPPQPEARAPIPGGRRFPAGRSPGLRGAAAKRPAARLPAPEGRSGGMSRCPRSPLRGQRRTLTGFPFQPEPRQRRGSPEDRAHSLTIPPCSLAPLRSAQPMPTAGRPEGKPASGTGGRRAPCAVAEVWERLPGRFR